MGPESPPPPSPPSLVATPEPADTLPTLPVLSMLPRGPLMPSPRLMLMPLFCMELMDTVVLATPDMAMVPTPMEDMPMVATPMPMELTTERGLLTLSPRLMPMLLFCMELMDMVVLDTPDTAMAPTPMEDMPMVATPMPTELTTERGPLMPSPRLMLMLTMELTAMALAMPDMAMVPTPMEDMPTVATPTPTELMLTESKLLSQSLVVKLLQTKAQK